MKLLLDMGLPRRAAELLRQAGHDAVHVGERGSPRLTDPEIVGVAAAEERTIVTMDADFSALLALSGRSCPSVVHLRVEGLGYRQVAAMIDQVVVDSQADIESGCIVSVTSAGTRTRRLPIARPR